MQRFECTVGVRYELSCWQQSAPRDKHSIVSWHSANCSLVSIECTKEGVKFACQGDIGSGSVQLRQHSSVDKPNEAVEIDLTEPVSLTFSLKYLTNFCKASGLSETVKLCLSAEVPLLVEYGLQNNSYLRFYLAPKVLHYHPTLRLDDVDSHRSVMRSERAYDFLRLRNKRHVFITHVGDTGRNVYDMHTERQSGSWFGRVRSARNAQLVSPALGAKRWLTPHLPFHVIARGISDKEINTVLCHSVPFAFACLQISRCFRLTFASFVAQMASDTLIPDTRVLAIASHVRLTMRAVP